jgi:hypothetical protein
MSWLGDVWNGLKKFLAKCLEVIKWILIVVAVVLAFAFVAGFAIAFFTGATFAASVAAGATAFSTVAAAIWSGVTAIGGYLWEALTGLADAVGAVLEYPAVSTLLTTVGTYVGAALGAVAAGSIISSATGLSLKTILLLVAAGVGLYIWVNRREEEPRRLDERTQ